MDDDSQLLFFERRVSREKKNLYIYIYIYFIRFFEAAARTRERITRIEYLAESTFLRRSKKKKLRKKEPSYDEPAFFRLAWV